MPAVFSSLMVICYPPLISDRVNEEFILVSGPCELHEDGGSTEGWGQIALDLRDGSRVLLEAEVDYPLPIEESVRCVFTDIDLEATCKIKRWNTLSSSDPSRGGVEAILQEGSFDRGGDIGHAGFHLVNFILGPHSLSSDVTLEVEDWRVEIERAVDSSPDLVDELRKGTGSRYGITHQGRIEKTSGMPMAKGEVDDFVELLYSYLSFARGYRCGPLLPWGCHYDGDLLWQDLTGTIVESWKNRSRWTKQVDNDDWSATFPSFYNLFQDHEEFLRRIINMYCRANYTSSLDIALIVSQAALEGISSEVLSNKVVNEDDFGGLTAQGKIELLLNHFSIPSDMPDARITHETLGEWVQGKFDDLSSVSSGPEAITRLRNAILHLDKEKLSRDLSVLDIECQYELLKLALHYVELVLLAWMDYEGPFWDRVEECTRTVPWT